MAAEASKAALRRLHDPGFARAYFAGHALDVGAGTDGLSRQQFLWPLLKSVRDWDVADGDAQLLDGLSPASFDLVHSSHSLEHMRDPYAAMARWFDVLKPNGHLVVLVPDEDLYEQGVFPSSFNPDHRSTFTMWKPTERSWSRVSVNIFSLIESLGPCAQPLKLELLHASWNNLGGRWDRTAGVIGESAIEFIVKRRP